MSAAGSPTNIAAIDSRAVFADGHLLYVRDGTVLAHPFDATSLRFTAAAKPLLSDLHYFRNTGLAAFSVSENGLLAWSSTRPAVRLAWLDRGWDTSELMAKGRLSVLRPELTCDATVAEVSRHFHSVLGAGATFIRFLGNAAVGREGWPSAEEFYKLEATVSMATLELPCVAICMFDLRSHSAGTIMKAAFEGHPVTFHRNCVRENPYYVPRSNTRSRSDTERMPVDAL